MGLSFETLILLPIGLGLLGFVEPCTIGGHLVFLASQEKRSPHGKIQAVTVFVVVRTLVMGVFGALIAFLGSKLIDVQTGLWLVFGALYLAIGIAFLVGGQGVFRKQFDLAPAVWKRATNPLLLGLAFGLNIPACAAPILFGLLGLTAAAGTVFTGFAMMALFGFSLSLPLVIIAIFPNLAQWLVIFSQKLRQRRWLIGIVFLALGLWSIWFGFYVNPADWAG